MDYVDLEKEIKRPKNGMGISTNFRLSPCLFSMICSINQTTDNCTISILFVNGLNDFSPKMKIKKEQAKICIILNQVKIRALKFQTFQYTVLSFL